MGCGKTLTAIAIAGAAFQKKAVSKLLVIAPTSVVAVWPKEFEEYADFPFVCQTLLGDTRQRLKAITDLSRYKYPKLRVAVINYESTWREDIFEALQQYDADMISLSGGMCRYTRTGHDEAGYFQDMSKAVRAVVSIPVLLTGGVKTLNDAEVLLANGAADLIGVGRELMKDPCWG